MIFKCWHKFWFQEQSPLPLALFRICFGFFVLQKCLLEFTPNFSAFYSVKALIQTSTLCIHWWKNYPVFDIFLLLPPVDLYRFIFFGLIVMAVICLTVGFCTRLSTIILYLGFLTLDKQAPFTLNGADDFIRLISFLLIFSPAGAMYSVDAWLKRRANKPQMKLASPWVQRMLQVQLSMAYFDSFICKITGSQWQQGTAVYYVSNRLEFQKFPLAWLTNHAPYYQILTYSTLAIELSLATLVWYRPLRYWILLAGVLMHMGIDWTMNLPYFEFLFVSGYLNFIEPKDLEKLIKLGKNYILRPCNRIFSNSHSINNEIVPGLIQQIKNPHWQFPALFMVVISILIIGALAADSARQKYLVVRNKYNYPLQLFREQVKAEANLKLCRNLPENNEQKLAAEEALALFSSERGDYDNADRILRHICKYRIEQKLPYNLALSKTMSSLGDIYLETGRLEAAELCYQSVLDYDIARAPKSSPSPAIDLNNLAVISYFRGLIGSDKTARYLNLEKANDLYIQSIHKLDLSNKTNSGQPNNEQTIKLTHIDILSNQYLALRDACRLKEADVIRANLKK